MMFAKSNTGTAATSVVAAAAGLIQFAVAARCCETQLFTPHLSPQAQIFSPSQANYSAEVPGRWTVWDQPTFCGAIKPATEQDVQQIVTVATANNISFLPISTGHGFSSRLADYQNVLQIDLDTFDSLQIDPQNNLVTVGGAVTFGQIVPALYKVGKEITVGNAACVGVNGAAVGAGIGTLQGLHGPLADSLVSARVVVASGKLVTVSATENAELFWAIRGAGANFGIITSATYRIYDATNNGNAVSANFIFAPPTNRSLFQFLESLDKSIPASLTAQVSMIYNKTSQHPVILANLVSHGPQSDIQPYIDQLTALKPLVSKTTTVPWTALDDSLFFGAPAASACTNGTYNNLYTIGLKKNDAATFEAYFDAFTAFSAAHPTYAGTLNIQRYSEAKAVANAGAGGVYPGREIKSHLLFSNIYPDSSLDSAVNGFMQTWRSKLQAASGFTDLLVYINYAHGDEGPNAWYGASNVAKLKGLKQKWDPKNFFTGGHPIVSK